MSDDLTEARAYAEREKRAAKECPESSIWRGPCPQCRENIANAEAVVALIEAEGT